MYGHKINSHTQTEKVKNSLGTNKIPNVILSEAFHNASCSRRNSSGILCATLRPIHEKREQLDSRTGGGIGGQSGYPDATGERVVV